jgi:branched-subunit amino acid ABC-type transport system permease component
VPAPESRSRISLALHPGYQGTRCVQLIVNIVVLAAIYALIACGYVLIYRVSRVLNLAHGELMMLGAYLLLTTASAFSGNALSPSPWPSCSACLSACSSTCS